MSHELVDDLLDSLVSEATLAAWATLLASASSCEYRIQMVVNLKYMELVSTGQRYELCTSHPVRE